METYGDDPCVNFEVHLPEGDSTHTEKTRRLIAQMHKAISIIQFKLEARMIDKRPEWGMAARKLICNIDPEKQSITLDGVKYPLKDTNLPTIDPKDPSMLTPEEQELIDKLHHSFSVSDKLKNT